MDDPQPRTQGEGRPPGHAERETPSKHAEDDVAERPLEQEMARSVSAPQESQQQLAAQGNSDEVDDTQVQSGSGPQEADRAEVDAGTFPGVQEIAVKKEHQPDSQGGELEARVDAGSILGILVDVKVDENRALSLESSLGAETGAGVECALESLEVAPNLSEGLPACSEGAGTEFIPIVAGTSHPEATIEPRQDTCDVAKPLSPEDMSDPGLEVPALPEEPADVSQADVTVQETVQPVEEKQHVEGDVVEPLRTDSEGEEEVSLSGEPEAPIALDSVESALSALAEDPGSVGEVTGGFQAVESSTSNTIPESVGVRVLEDSSDSDGLEFDDKSTSEALEAVTEAVVKTEATLDPPKEDAGRADATFTSVSSADLLTAVSTESVVVVGAVAIQEEDKKRDAADPMEPDTQQEAISLPQPSTEPERLTGSSFKYGTEMQSQPGISETQVSGALESKLEAVANKEAEERGEEVAHTEAGMEGLSEERSTTEGNPGTKSVDAALDIEAVSGVVGKEQLGETVVGADLAMLSTITGAGEASIEPLSVPSETAHVVGSDDDAKRPEAVEPTGAGELLMGACTGEKGEPLSMEAIGAEGTATVDVPEQGPVDNESAFVKQEPGNASVSTTVAELSPISGTARMVDDTRDASRELVDPLQVAGAQDDTAEASGESSGDEATEVVKNERSPEGKEVFDPLAHPSADTPDPVAEASSPTTADAPVEIDVRAVSAEMDASNPSRTIPSLEVSAIDSSQPFAQAGIDGIQTSESSVASLSDVAEPGSEPSVRPAEECVRLEHTLEEIARPALTDIPSCSSVDEAVAEATKASMSSLVPGEDPGVKNGYHGELASETVSSAAPVVDEGARGAVGGIPVVPVVNNDERVAIGESVFVSAEDPVEVTDPEPSLHPAEEAVKLEHTIEDSAKPECADVPDCPSDGEAGSEARVSQAPLVMPGENVGGAYHEELASEAASFAATLVHEDVIGRFADVDKGTPLGGHEEGVPIEAAGGVSIEDSAIPEPSVHPSEEGSKLEHTPEGEGVVSLRLTDVPSSLADAEAGVEAVDAQVPSLHAGDDHGSRNGYHEQLVSEDVSPSAPLVSGTSDLEQGVPVQTSEEGAGVRESGLSSAAEVQGTIPEPSVHPSEEGAKLEHTLEETARPELIDDLSSPTYQEAGSEATDAHGGVLVPEEGQSGKGYHEGLVSEAVGAIAPLDEGVIVRASGDEQGLPTEGNEEDSGSEEADMVGAGDSMESPLPEPSIHPSQDVTKMGHTSEESTKLELANMPSTPSDGEAATDVVEVQGSLLEPGEHQERMDHGYHEELGSEAVCASAPLVDDTQIGGVSGADKAAASEADTVRPRDLQEGSDPEPSTNPTGKGADWEHTPEEVAKLGLPDASSSDSDGEAALEATDVQSLPLAVRPDQDEMDHGYHEELVSESLCGTTPLVGESIVASISSADEVVRPPGGEDVLDSEEARFFAGNPAEGMVQEPSIRPSEEYPRLEHTSEEVARPGLPGGTFSPSDEESGSEAVEVQSPSVATEKGDGMDHGLHKELVSEAVCAAAPVVAEAGTDSKSDGEEMDSVKGTEEGLVAEEAGGIGKMEDIPESSIHPDEESAKLSHTPEGFVRPQLSDVASSPSDGEARSEALDAHGPSLTLEEVQGGANRGYSENLMSEAIRSAAPLVDEDIAGGDEEASSEGHFDETVSEETGAVIPDATVRSTVAEPSIHPDGEGAKLERTLEEIARPELTDVLPSQKDGEAGSEATDAQVPLSVPEESPVLAEHGYDADLILEAVSSGTPVVDADEIGVMPCLAEGAPVEGSEGLAGELAPGPVVESSIGPEYEDPISVCDPDVGLPPEVPEVMKDITEDMLLKAGPGEELEKEVSGRLLEHDVQASAVEMALVCEAVDRNLATAAGLGVVTEGVAEVGELVQEGDLNPGLDLQGMDMSTVEESDEPMVVSGSSPPHSPEHAPLPLVQPSEVEIIMLPELVSEAVPTRAGREGQAPQDVGEASIDSVVKDLTVTPNEAVVESEVIAMHVEHVAAGSVEPVAAEAQMSRQSEGTTEPPMEQEAGVKLEAGTDSHMDFTGTEYRGNEVPSAVVLEPEVYASESEGSVEEEKPEVQLSSSSTETGLRDEAPSLHGQDIALLDSKPTAQLEFLSVRGPQSRVDVKEGESFLPEPGSRPIDESAFCADKPVGGIHSGEPEPASTIFDASDDGESWSVDCTPADQVLTSTMESSEGVQEQVRSRSADLFLIPESGRAAETTLEHVEAADNMAPIASAETCLLAASAPLLVRAEASTEPLTNTAPAVESAFVEEVSDPGLEMLVSPDLMAAVSQAEAAAGDMGHPMEEHDNIYEGVGGDAFWRGTVPTELNLSGEPVAQVIVGLPEADIVSDADMVCPAEGAPFVAVESSTGGVQAATMKDHILEERAIADGLEVDISMEQVEAVVAIYEREVTSMKHEERNDAIDAAVSDVGKSLPTDSVAVRDAFAKHGEDQRPAADSDVLAKPVGHERFPSEPSIQPEVLRHGLVYESEAKLEPGFQEAKLSGGLEAKAEAPQVEELEGKILTESGAIAGDSVSAAPFAVRYTDAALDADAIANIAAGFEQTKTRVMELDLATAAELTMEDTNEASLEPPQKLLDMTPFVKLDMIVSVEEPGAKAHDTDDMEAQPVTLDGLFMGSSLGEKQEAVLQEVVESKSGVPEMAGISMETDPLVHSATVLGQVEVADEEASSTVQELSQEECVLATDAPTPLAPAPLHPSGEPVAVIAESLHVLEAGVAPLAEEVSQHGWLEAGMEAEPALSGLGPIMIEKAAPVMESSVERESVVLADGSVQPGQLGGLSEDTAEGAAEPPRSAVEDTAISRKALESSSEPSQVVSFAVALVEVGPIVDVPPTSTWMSQGVEYEPASTMQRGMAWALQDPQDEEAKEEDARAETLVQADVDVTAEWMASTVPETSMVLSSNPFAEMDENEGREDEEERQVYELYDKPILLPEPGTLPAELAVPLPKVADSRESGQPAEDLPVSVGVLEEHLMVLSEPTVKVRPSMETAMAPSIVVGTSEPLKEPAVNVITEGSPEESRKPPDLSLGRTGRAEATEEPTVVSMTVSEKESTLEPGVPSLVEAVTIGAAEPAVEVESASGADANVEEDDLTRVVKPAPAPGVTDEAEVAVAAASMIEEKLATPKLISQLQKPWQSAEQLEPVAGVGEYGRYSSAAFDPLPADGQETEMVALEELLPGKEYLYEGKIEPGDIKQGFLGDCWFLSAIAALAEFPGLVENVFLHREVPKDGVYKLRFFKSGRWVSVAVNSNVPSKEGQPIYAKSVGNEMWVMLLEKAYAKLHGSYKQLVLGNPNDALQDLTGAPCLWYKFDTEKFKKLEETTGFWSLMKDYDGRGYLMAACTAGKDEFTEKGGKSGSGLVNGHAYTVIKVRDSHGHQLVNVRNPWGKFEWGGAWSDNSREWEQYPEVKADLNPVLDVSDGSFWMAYHDFKQSFVGMGVCCVRHGNRQPWNEVHIPCQFDNRDICRTGDTAHLTRIFKLEVTERTHAFLGLHQEDPRLLGAPTPLKIGFYLVNEKKVLTAKKHTRSARCQLEVMLEPGFYSVVVKGLSFTGKNGEECSFPDSTGEVLPRRFVFTVHSDNPVTAELEGEVIMDSPGKELIEKITELPTEPAEDDLLKVWHLDQVVAPAGEPDFLPCSSKRAAELLPEPQVHPVGMSENWDVWRDIDGTIEPGTVPLSLTSVVSEASALAEILKEPVADVPIVPTAPVLPLVAEVVVLVSEGTKEQHTAPHSEISAFGEETKEPLVQLFWPHDKEAVIEPSPWPVTSPLAERGGEPALDLSVAAYTEGEPPAIIGGKIMTVLTGEGEPTEDGMDATEKSEAQNRAQRAEAEEAGFVAAMGLDEEQRGRLYRSAPWFAAEALFPSKEVIEYGSLADPSYEPLLLPQHQVEMVPASRIAGANLQYLYSDIKPSDIRQGILEDSWFLSAVGILAEFPGLIERVFVQREVPSNGIFRLRFFKSGRYVTVAVSSKLPAKDGRLVYGHSANNGELWVSILEKGYAKLHGSYGQMLSGLVADAFQDLTGVPCLKFNFSSAKFKKLEAEGGFWSLLQQYVKEGYVLAGCTSSDSDSSSPAKRTNGLVNGHAYAILEVRESHGHRLVHLQDPFGKFEWDGAWSDNSPEWSNFMDVTEEIQPVLDGTDGSFWMAYRDFIKKFAGIAGCCVKQDTSKSWKELQLPCTFIADDWSSSGNTSQPTRIFRLKVSSKTCMFVSLHQEDPRMMGAAEPFKVGIWIMDHQNEYLASKQTIEATCQVEAILDPGLYRVMVKAFTFTTKSGQVRRFPDTSGKSLPRRFVLTIHSDKVVTSGLIKMAPSDTPLRRVVVVPATLLQRDPAGEMYAFPENHEGKPPSGNLEPVNKQVVLFHPESATAPREVFSVLREIPVNTQATVEGTMEKDVAPRVVEVKAVLAERNVNVAVKMVRAETEIPVGIGEEDSEIPLDPEPTVDAEPIKVVPQDCLLPGETGEEPDTEPFLEPEDETSQEPAIRAPARLLSDLVEPGSEISERSESMGDDGHIPDELTGGQDLEPPGLVIKERGTVVEDALLEPDETEQALHIPHDKLSLFRKQLPWHAAMSLDLVDGIEYGIISDASYDPLTVEHHGATMVEAKQILPDADLFGNGIDPEDVRQGQLDDGWFLSSVAALAGYRGIIERLFLQPVDPADDGVLRMRFFKSGRWATVAVNTKLPCKDGRLVYAHSPDNRLWGSFLEKGYAKLHGSYARLNQGSPSDALHDLTGAPCITFTFASTKFKQLEGGDGFWPLLKVFDSKGYIIVACGQGKRSSGQKILVNTQAYAVAQVKEVFGFKLLEVQYSLGTFEWNGAWSSTSDTWAKHPEVLEELKPVLDGSSGTFWMEYKDFLKHFLGVAVCCIRHDMLKPWKEVKRPCTFVADDWSADGNVAQPTRIFRMRVLGPTEVFVALHQEDIRLLGVATPLKVGVWIIDKENRPVASKKTHDATCQIEVMLNPGFYRVIVKAFDYTTKDGTVCNFPDHTGDVLPRRFVLTLHSESPITLELERAPPGVRPTPRMSIYPGTDRGEVLLVEPVGVLAYAPNELGKAPAGEASYLPRVVEPTVPASGEPVASESNAKETSVAEVGLSDATIEIDQEPTALFPGAVKTQAPEPVVRQLVYRPTMVSGRKTVHAVPETTVSPVGEPLIEPLDSDVVTESASEPRREILKRLRRIPEVSSLPGVSMSMTRPVSEAGAGWATIQHTTRILDMEYAPTGCRKVPMAIVERAEVEPIAEDTEEVKVARQMGIADSDMRRFLKSLPWQATENLLPSKGVQGYGKTAHAVYDPPIVPSHNVSIVKAEDFLPTKGVLYPSKVEAADIQQGLLEDGWLLSTVAALLEFPGLMERVFVNKTTPADGIFRLRFFKSGRWVTVAVRSTLPWKDGKLAYGSSASEYLWPSLLEKAYAKLHGSYERLGCGSPVDALQDLTGAPCASFSFSNPKFKRLEADGGFWPLLESTHKSGFMTIACASNGGVKGKKKATGLLNTCAYAVLEVKELYGHRLVHVRNTWGKFKWTGAWSNSSSEWRRHPQVMEELQPMLDGSDGSFWIGYSDFLKKFAGVAICYLQRDGKKPWKVLQMGCSFVADDWSAAGNDTQPTRVFRLKVQERTHLFAGLHQESPRMLGAPEPFKVGIWVMDKQNRYLATKQTQDATCQVDCVLEPGLYRVMVKAFSFTGKDGEQCKFPDPEGNVLPRRFVLMVHSEKPVAAKLLAEAPTDIVKSVKERDVIISSQPAADIRRLLNSEPGKQAVHSLTPHREEPVAPIIYCTDVAAAIAQRKSLAECTAEPPQPVVRVVRHPLADSIMVAPFHGPVFEIGEEPKEMETEVPIVESSYPEPVAYDKVSEEETANVGTSATPGKVVEVEGKCEPQHDVAKEVCPVLEPVERSTEGKPDVEPLEPVESLVQSESALDSIGPAHTESAVTSDSLLNAVDAVSVETSEHPAEAVTPVEGAASDEHPEYLEPVSSIAREQLGEDDTEADARSTVESEHDSPVSEREQLDIVWGSEPGTPVRPQTTLEEQVKKSVTSESPPPVREAGDGSFVEVPPEEKRSPYGTPKAQEVAEVVPSQGQASEPLLLAAGKPREGAEGEQPLESTASAVAESSNARAAPSEANGFEEVDVEEPKQAGAMVTNTSIEGQEEELLAKSLGIAEENLPDLWKSVPWQAVETITPAKGLEAFGMIADPEYQPSPVPRHGAQMVPAERLLSNPSLFSGKLDPSHIKQGMLADLWFLSAVAALAEFPVLLHNVFVQNEMSDDGVYRLRFFKSGRLVQIAVDTKVPAKDFRPVYAYSSANELWVMLMEKAYAKLHGSYEALIGGSPSDVLQDLTGAPCITYAFTSTKFQRFESTGGFWTLLKGYCDRGFILTACAAGADECEENGVKREGALVNSHAFAVTSLRELERGVHRLLHVRDPRNSFKWTGAWSHRSANWTKYPHVTKEIKPILDGSDHGFWISYEDLLKNFIGMTVCCVKRDGTKPWKEFHIPCSFIADDWSSGNNPSQPTRIFRLKITEPTRVFVGLHQEDPRLLGVPEPLKVGLWIMDKQNQFVTSKQTPEVVCQLETILQPGQYRVMTKAFSYTNGKGELVKFPDVTGTALPRRFTLIVHSDRQVGAHLMLAPKSSTKSWKELHTHCSFVADDWSALGNPRQPTRMFRVKVTEPTRIIVGIDQEDPQNLRVQQPFKVGVWVMDKQSQFLAMKQSYESYCQVEVTLQPGFYRIMVKAFSYMTANGICKFPDPTGSILPRPFILSVLSEKHVDVFLMTSARAAKLLTSVY